METEPTGCVYAGIQIEKKIHVDTQRKDTQTDDRDVASDDATHTSMGPSSNPKSRSAAESPAHGHREAEPLFLRGPQSFS